MSTKSELTRRTLAIAEASNNWRLVGTIDELQADAHRLLAFFDLASAKELPTRRSHIRSSRHFRSVTRFRQLTCAVSQSTRRSAPLSSR